MTGIGRGRLSGLRCARIYVRNSLQSGYFRLAKERTPVCFPCMPHTSPILVFLLAASLLGSTVALAEVTEPDSEETAVTGPAPEATEPEVAAPEPDGDVEPEPPMDEVRRTPMTLPSTAPFGASQRGLPPVVNPAHPSLSDRRFRFGTVFDFGVGLEVGDADDFDREVDDILDTFERLEEQAEAFSVGAPPSEAEIEAFLNDLNLFEEQANELVRDLTDSAYAKLTGSASFPLAPIAVRSDFLRGTLTLNADGILEARVAVESTDDAFDFGLRGVPADDVDRFETDPDGVPVVILDDGTRRRIEPTDDAGVAVQGGMVGRLGAGYSSEVWRSPAGSVHAGGVVNVYRTTLVRGGVLFSDDDLEDTARDEFEDNQKTSSGIGLDLAAAWVANWYSVGGVLRNINEPSFEYPDTSDSAFFQANPQARRNGSRWRMDRQLTLEGAVFTPAKRWIAAGALDLNRMTDTTGDDYKWASVIGAYEPARAWVPSPRVGLRKNLVGEKLTYIGGGLSFFRALHLDIASSLERTSLDGEKIPRGFQANVALGRRF